MGFFDFLNGKNKEDSEPQLTASYPELESISKGGLSDKTAGNPITNRNMLLAQLLEKEQLLNKSNQDFKTEEDRINSLPSAKNQEEYISRNNQLEKIRNDMTNYQNQIRDILRNNGISPNNNSDIYNLYVDGRDVGDERYSNQRLKELNDYLNSPDAFSTDKKLPTISEIKDGDNRRRDTLTPDSEKDTDDLDVIDVPIDEEGNPIIDETEQNLERRNERKDPNPNIDETEQNLERRNDRKEPNPFGDYDNQGLKDYKDDLLNQLRNDPDNQDLKDAIGSVGNEQQNRGQDLQNDLTKQKSEQLHSSNIPTDSEPTTHSEIEHGETQIYHGVDSEQSNPFIEQGKENIPDYSIFSDMLGSTAQVSFEFVKTYISETNPYTAVGFEFFNQFSPYGVKESVEYAFNAVIENSYDDVGSLKGGNKKRMKLRMNHEKHKVFNNPVLYPFIVIAINFYLARTEREGIQLNSMIYNSLYYILTNYLKTSKTNTDFLLTLFKLFPKELDTAFKKNRNQIRKLSETETKAINDYVKKIIVNYDIIFTPSRYNKAVKKYENGGDNLIQILRNLSNPLMLHEINSVFETADNLLIDIKNNKDILIGLLGLVYAEARKNNSLDQEAILSQAMVDGIVYYKRTTPLIKKEKNIDILILQEMSKPVGERNIPGYTINYNSEKLAEFTDSLGNSILAFRGTNLKDKKDIKLNFLNFAGSSEMFTNPEYSDRYDTGIKLIEKKQKEISNLGKGSIRVIGNSLGAIGAMFMGLYFKDVQISAYQPVISNSQLTSEFMKDLKDRGSNIQFFAVNEDPISKNLGKYKNDFNIQYFEQSKFYNSHDLNNFN